MKIVGGSIVHVGWAGGEAGGNISFSKHSSILGTTLQKMNKGLSYRPLIGIPKSLKPWGTFYSIYPPNIVIKAVLLIIAIANIS